MRFVLTDYQEVAAADVCHLLRRATSDYDEQSRYSAVSLTAPTGAGKTVIATAVIERLFTGDDNVGPDPQATVLWVTDDPSLNEQTSRKMLAASSRLKPGQLLAVDEAFDQETFDVRKVHFLNIQKLGARAQWVQSGTDKRRWSVWQTIANTIKARGGHFYVVIDEAHRGTGTSDRTRPTIVKRIISDPTGENPPAPVVWGITATAERFNKVMDEAVNPSRTRTPVAVPVDEVRASGLLKDTLDIQHPTESQPAVATLTRIAAQYLRLVTERWAAYAVEQDEPEVIPAMVIQLPPAAADALIAEVLETLEDEWPELSGRAIAHSLESHTTLDIAGRAVRYVAPQDIQDDQSIRVVLFKEALTTGWDCPRAELMLSLRRAEDVTYITQLIGRVLRTPLARRIPTDELLNSVRLILPFFDEASVDGVIDYLVNDKEAPPADYTKNAVECHRNPEVSDAVFALIEALPSYIVPGRAHRSQVTRLHTLATRLDGDGILDGALTKADAHLIKTIEQQRARLEAEGSWQGLLDGLGIIDMRDLTVSLADEVRTATEHAETVDIRDINALFATAKRRLRDGLATRYWDHLYTRALDGADPDDLPYPDDFKIEVCAAAADPTLVEAVEKAAADLVQQWLKKYAPQIAQLGDAAQNAYEQVRAQAKDSEVTDIRLPTSVMASTGSESAEWQRHLFTTTKGTFPAKLNGWEAPVVTTELTNGAVAWYRNPTGGARSLRVPFTDGQYETPMYPDFVVVHETDDGLRPSIIDPHSYALADAGPKWRGLAEYAKAHGDAYQRIEAIIEDPDGQLLRLNLKSDTVRKALSNANGKESILQTFRDHGGLY
jgi:type III restriction enzyme